MIEILVIGFIVAVLALMLEGAKIKKEILERNN